MDNKNVKKLLCNNIVCGNKCAYKNRCMFAHDLNEQQIENNRKLTIDMITKIDDLSLLDIYNKKDIFTEMLTLTKECKNCLNNKCTGGYNCKYGACVQKIKICYDDLIYGKCLNKINEQFYCQCGIHLTEKKLIPYNQRHNIEISVKKPMLFTSHKITYNNKMNTISITLTDETIDIADDILKGIINEKDIIRNNKLIYDQFMNDDKIDNIEELIRKEMKNKNINTISDESSDEEKYDNLEKIKKSINIENKSYKNIVKHNTLIDDNLDDIVFSDQIKDDHFNNCNFENIGENNINDNNEEKNEINKIKDLINYDSDIDQEILNELKKLKKK